MSLSRFANVPQVRFNRSKFDLSHGKKTAFNVGDLVPLDLIEVLPGDSFKCKTAGVLRCTTSFLRPVMDNLYMDIHHFFIPLRLLYDNAEKVFGNPSPSAYIDADLDAFPTVDGTVGANTVADYLGLPLGSYNENLGNAVSVLPFRAFALVYDQWFRNENTTDEIYIRKDNQAGGILNEEEWSPTNIFGKLPKVSKRRDLFTSCLPSPQKGSPVNVPLNGLAKVVGLDRDLFNANTDPDKSYRDFLLNYLPISVSATPQYQGEYSNLTLRNDNPSLKRYITAVTYPDTSEGIYNGSDLYLNLQQNPQNIGAYADLGQLDGKAFDINDLRFGFALQKMFERDALYGSRYNEYLLGHFGVTSPDARLQVTEYLGGGRIPVSVQQVAQTSQGTEESPLGAVAGYSLSNGKSYFNKGFTEHGYILTVGCIKQMHTYCQGVEKLWFRTERNDFYDPLFATIGEQPVYTSQLFYDGNEKGLKGNVFGYNEAWAEYRSLPNGLTGEMRTTSPNTLDIWHFGDHFETRPFLSKEFDEETPQFVDRTISAPSTSISQFIADFYFKIEAIRVMPTYSVPSLVDHH